MLKSPFFGLYRVLMASNWKSVVINFDWLEVFYKPGNFHVDNSILMDYRGSERAEFQSLFADFHSFLTFLALYDDLNQLLSNFMMRHEIWVLLTPITLPQHYPGQSYGLQKVLARSDTSFESPKNAKIAVFRPRELIFGIQASFCPTRRYTNSYLQILILKVPKRASK